MLMVAVLKKQTNKHILRQKSTSFQLALGCYHMVFSYLLCIRLSGSDDKDLRVGSRFWTGVIFVCGGGVGTYAFSW